MQHCTVRHRTGTEIVSPSMYCRLMASTVFRRFGSRLGCETTERHPEGTVET